MNFRRGTACTLFVCCLLASSAVAQDDGAVAEAVVAEAVVESAVAAAVAEAALAGHNAWMLTCSALVLFMTAPGLAMFYGGLVRSKNVLSVMMQCIFLMGLMTVIWGLWGYSLAFGGAPGEESYSPWIGNSEYLFMRNVQADWPDGAAAAVIPMEGAIPRLTHMVFQGMFFLTFSYYRIFGWISHSVPLFKDCDAVLKSGSLEQHRPGKTFVLRLFLGLDVVLGLLQCYWYSEILKAVFAIAS